MTQKEAIRFLSKLGRVATEIDDKLLLESFPTLNMFWCKAEDDFLIYNKYFATFATLQHDKYLDGASQFTFSYQIRGVSVTFSSSLENDEFILQLDYEKAKHWTWYPLNSLLFRNALNQHSINYSIQDNVFIEQQNFQGKIERRVDTTTAYSRICAKFKPYEPYWPLEILPYHK